MTATISFPVAPGAVYAPIAPARVGIKTIAMNVDYVGCHVSISRTSEAYYNVQARHNAIRGMAVTSAMVWHDSKNLQWVVDQHVTFGESAMEITRTRTLAAALGIAQWQVASDGHDLGAW